MSLVGSLHVLRYFKSTTVDLHIKSTGSPQVSHDRSPHPPPSTQTQNVRGAGRLDGLDEVGRRTRSEVGLTVSVSRRYSLCERG